MMALGVYIRLSVPRRKRPESAEHRRFATAPDVLSAGFRKHSGYLKPTAVFVPVGEFFVATCACSVGAAREGSWAGERRVRPRKRLTCCI
jgi:hypothetical protein